ncbi:hypothetical protein HMH01_12850 [Halovulum dunhuangense]|uniref:Lipoprotein n=1 Tax=Halovulum dunhuangense TaxID=1505036 RepID=A0A849L5D1_9RHOB|nr:hypothetical protein [Halovulum dunhuangense]NNU81327.1 hypothetical protein [Halovulum dunhuangense]
MSKFCKAGALVALFALSACGDTFEERALIGAGAGAATAVATDGNIATGALLGGAANVAFCSQYPSRC